MLKNERGITLVALVITIVVLIILATVSITLALNPESSILGGAETAKEKADQDSLNVDKAIQDLETKVQGILDEHVS